MIMTGKETFSLLIETPWIIFVLYWILGAIKTRATREKESAASRIAILVIEGTGYVLIFSGSAGIGFLGTRFMPRTLASAGLGVVLTWSGIGLRSGPAIIWQSIGVQGSPSRKTTNSSAPVLTPICGTPSTPAWFWRRWARPSSARVAMRPRCMPGADWILVQSQERGSYAQPAIRRCIPRAPEAHRLPDTKVPLNGYFLESRKLIADSYFNAFTRALRRDL